MEKIIKVGEKEITFRANAATPRNYRAMFGREFFKDIEKLSEEGEQNYEVLENIAYIMAVKDKPVGVEKWLEQFGMFDILEIVEELVSLWGVNAMVTVNAIEEAEEENGKN